MSGWAVRIGLYIIVSLAIFWLAGGEDVNMAIGAMVLATPILSSWIAWRGYQIALMAAGLLTFRYWIFDGQSDDKWFSLLVTAIFFSFLFVYGMTILTTWCLDRLRPLFSSKSSQQASDDLHRDATTIEGFQRLTGEERPDDCITLDPSGRERLR
jgi:hypothetical protein